MLSVWITSAPACKIKLLELISEGKDFRLIQMDIYHSYMMLPKHAKAKCLATTKYIYTRNKSVIIQT